MDKKFERGSEWRKWDLHVHTASSYDSDYKGTDSDELLVQALKDNHIAAVAITDHFKIDKERISNIKTLAPDITVFPGVELRTDKGGSNIHVIAIFHENYDLDKLSSSFKAIMIDKYAKNPTDDYKIYWDFEHIKEFVSDHKGVISIHAKKTSGIDEVINNSTLFNQAIKEEYAQCVHFFEMRNLSGVNEYKTKVFPTIGERPLIICSDNHDPRSYSTNELLWIKSDPTFEGLLQCIHQPSERIFVGNIPPKLDKVNKNKQSYIDSIAVYKADDAKNTLENWFNFTLPINQGLTAIIGNKGSGKSALSDIMGHFCKSNSMGDASFLNSKRFRKSPENLANDYSGSVTWIDDKKDVIDTLANIEYTSTIENAQYLPQKYIETVCNELGNEFQKEINNVIFSYVDETEKGKAKNLDELIEGKTKSILTRIQETKNQLVEINGTIIKLENKLTDSYKKRISDDLEKRQETLSRHEKNKPQSVDKPQNTQNAENDAEMRMLDLQTTEIETEISETKDTVKNLNENLTELKDTKEEINSIVEKIDALNLKLLNVSKVHDFDAENFRIAYKHPSDQLCLKIDGMQQELLSLQSKLDDSEDANNDISLYTKLKSITNRKNELLLQADTGEKAYQKYLSDVKEWEKTKVEIQGTALIEGSIECLSNELKYINENLISDYDKSKNDRLDKVKFLFSLKQEKAAYYSSVYAPIEKELDKLLNNEDDKICFEVNIAIHDKGISNKLLNFISRKYVGIFYGKTESQNKMSEIISQHDFNQVDGICGFVEGVLKCAYEDKENLSEKIKDRENFYNLLTSLDYLDVEYSLKMNNKNLNELSAGQRGIVLLIFYLALNKNEIPIIIDQPEDNLDNQSVFDKLVPCICEAKKRRQVIIVTHNPNIAIACDAEQIIYCSIDKSNNNISYFSGSIENEEIRNKVVDVLEGTKPAFALRNAKYSNALSPSITKV